MDELGALRARDAGLAPVRGDHPDDGGGKAAEDKGKHRSPSRKKEKKKEKKRSRGRSSKKKKKEKHRSPSPKDKEDKAEKAKSSRRKRSSSTCSSRSAKLDGRQPRLASMKDYDNLFAGTGLDRREKVRRRVLHRAKKAAKRKTKDKSSSGSGSSSSKETSDFGEEVEDTLFKGETKIQRVAQRAPGALEVFHRLRATIPAKLWRWRVVTGWKWRHGKEHVNSLELRAILNSVRWRIEHCGHINRRMLHLTDSLVCLHALTRGRTSSRRLRATMSRINALVLCSNAQFFWAYVSTDTNPADKPSRWGSRVKTKFRNA